MNTLVPVAARLVAFDPLPADVSEVRLQINEFVLSFDADGNPEASTSVEFRFAVDQGVVKLEPTAAKDG